MCIRDSAKVVSIGGMQIRDCALSTIRVLVSRSLYRRRNFLLTLGKLRDVPDTFFPSITLVWVIPLQRICCLLYTSGTNPPAVERLISRIKDYALGYKLPGAGGGGYLYIVAKDPEASLQIRRLLTVSYTHLI